MNNIFKEIRSLIGNEYDFRIEINPIEFNVILSKKMFEDLEITITYGIEDFCYVNFNALCNYLEDNNETLKDYDFGYDYNDIQAINKVMNWINDNSDMISNYISKCDKNCDKYNNYEGVSYEESK